jgi:hypothetical protein
MRDVRELLAAHRRACLALDDLRREMRVVHASAKCEGQWWLCWRHLALLGALVAAERDEPPRAA